MDLVTLMATCAIGAVAPCDDPAFSSSLIVEPLMRAEASEGTDAFAWRPYIAEAARRFAIPEAWIEAVIQAESGGRTHLNGQPITSPKGAMGLMQVMPATYAELRVRHGLGSDAYDPRDNIFAGTAYLQEMFARYGYPWAFAAYNAGPGRLDAYLIEGRDLPDETLNYLASIEKTLTGSASPPRIATLSTSPRGVKNTVASPLFFTLSGALSRPSWREIYGPRAAEIASRNSAPTGSPGVEKPVAGSLFVPLRTTSEKP